MFIKKISINLLIFIFLFIFFDLIFSNLIYKETFRYACYKYETNFYSLEPNCIAIEKHEASGKTFKVNTDTNGYRYLSKKRKKKYEKEIIFLGDSHAYGLGLKYKNTFVGKIENNLNNFKVHNLAVPSYSPSIYNYQIKKLINNGHKPNKIFIILDISDFSQESFRWKNKNFGERPNLITEIQKKKERDVSGWKKFRRDNFKGYRLLSLNLREFFRSFKKQNASEQIKKTYWGEFTYTNKNDLEKKYWKNLSFDQTLKKINKNLFEISSLSKTIDSEFYIVIFPWAETLEYGQSSFNYENYMIKTCKNINCTQLINLFPEFRKLKKNNLDWRKKLYLLDDIHLNKNGQDIIYREILKIL